MDTKLVNRHCTAVAQQFCGYAAPLESIAKYVAQSMGSEAPDLPALMHYLAKEETQDELAARHDVALWRGPGQMWRLASLNTPQTMEQIEQRLSSYPDSTSTQCSWCLIDERNRYATELIKVFDLHGAPIHRRLVHAACAKPFKTMLIQYERAKKGETA